MGWSVLWKDWIATLWVRMIVRFNSSVCPHHICCTNILLAIKSWHVGVLSLTEWHLVACPSWPTKQCLEMLGLPTLALCMVTTAYFHLHLVPKIHFFFFLNGQAFHVLLGFLSFIKLKNNYEIQNFVGFKKKSFCVFEKYCIVLQNGRQQKF